MKDTVASVTVSGAAGVTVATGTLATINQYAPLIGICISLTSLLFAVGFYIANHRKEKIKNEEYLLNLKEQLRAEILTEIIGSERG